MGLPYRARKRVLQIVKGSPVLRVDTALGRDSGIDLRASIALKIKQGVLVLIAPIQIAIGPDEFVSRG
jgi:hypothetical protein